MPKMRGFKPEIWTDDKFVELSPYARLLFMGMWNYACDNGHVEDKPAQLKMRILPADNCDVSALIEEMLNQGMVIREKDHLTVRNLPIHQRLDKRYFTTCEHCAPEGDTTGARRAPVGDTTRPPRVPMMKEGRKEGEEGDSPSRERSTGMSSIDRFEEFWDAYGKKVGRKKAEQKWRLALKRSGVTADLLIERAAAYIARQQSAGKHPEFTKDPATWLNGEHWSDEIENSSEADPYAHLPTAEQLRERRLS